MVSNTQKRDIIIFSYGIILGILSNLLVENMMAYQFPEGIPKDQAFIGILLWGIVVIFFTAFVIHFIHRTNEKN